MKKKLSLWVSRASLVLLLATAGCSTAFSPAYENLYEYCLTDPDVKKQADFAGTSVEKYCDELLRASGYGPSNGGSCSSGSCPLKPPSGSK